MLHNARLDKEVDYQEGKKSLHPSHKSYKAWMQSEMTSYDTVKTDLKQKREHLKKNYEPGVRQIDYLKQMEFLLQEKLRFKKEGKGDQGERGIERRTGQMDMLIMNHD